MSAVVREISDGIFRHQLEGFEKYPRGLDGRFLEVFNEQVISVDHARAVALAFRDKMPTLQGIVDTALNLRPKFEDHEPERKKWEREYGKPDPNWSKNLVGGSHERNKLRMLWQAIRDTVYYTEGPGAREFDRIKDRGELKASTGFWARQALRLREQHPEELAAFRRDELSRGWDDLLKEDWANEVQPVSVEAAPEKKRITQADFDALKDPPNIGDADQDADRWE